MPLKLVKPQPHYVTPFAELVNKACKYYPQSKRMQLDFVRMRTHLEESGKWILSRKEQPAPVTPTLSIVKND